MDRDYFTVSKPYRISLILFLITSPLIYVCNLSKVPDNAKHAYAIGAVIGILILSLLIGCLFYFLSKNKIRNSAIAFNVVLILSTFGQCSEFAKRVQEQQGLKDLQSVIDESHAHDSEVFYNTFTHS